MEKYLDFDKLTITISENKITSFIDNSNGNALKKFHERLTKSNIPKIYIVKDDSQYLYIGTTTQSLSSRFRYGLKATGNNGYHGYKWKSKESVQLFAWCFEKYNKLEMESIEAELVFLIRLKTGMWPLMQNEIHFNNHFNEAKKIAEQILNQIF